jgi:hypothetical protein
VKKRPSDVGFCQFDDNAPAVTAMLVRKARDLMFEAESHMNRLYKGRDAIELEGTTLTEFQRLYAELGQMRKTAFDIMEAQSEPLRQAAE